MPITLCDGYFMLTRLGRRVHRKVEVRLLVSSEKLMQYKICILNLIMSNSLSLQFATDDKW